MARRLRAMRCSSTFTFLRNDLLTSIFDLINILAILDSYISFAIGGIALRGQCLALSLYILHSLPFVYCATFCLVITLCYMFSYSVYAL